MGFLFQKLHRPRSYDYLKKSEKYKPWDDRLRMPQFAWANDPEAVEEVMTFVLGLTDERINARYLPKTHYTPAQLAVAQGSKVLNRHNCTGCHVLDMPKFMSPRAPRWPRSSPTSSRTCAPPTAAAPTTSWRALSRPHLRSRKKLGNDEIESELALAPDDGKRRSRSRGCRPISSRTR